MTTGDFILSSLADLFRESMQRQTRSPIIAEAGDDAPYLFGSQGGPMGARRTPGRSFW